MQARFAFVALLGSILVLGACASSGAADEPVVAGTTTRGGVDDDTTVIHVTSLADSGPGTLRAALGEEGPRVIVFDVGGRIDLGSDLIIRAPFVTIAGQTAPSPGISLWGASFRIRTHDVIVQHIAVRPGPGRTKKQNDNRDAISIDGNPKRRVDNSFQVLVENVSASWSVDEALSLWYKTTQDVTVRNSIVAEALNNAGHPKGQHSMGLLVGTNAGPAQVTGNLLASNKFRNPVMARGSTAYVANNYVVNPGWNAIHFYTKGRGDSSRATVVNNVIEAGQSSQPKLRGVLVPTDPEGSTEGDAIYVDGNEAVGFGPNMQDVGVTKALVQAAQPPVIAPDWRLLPTSEVKQWVLRYAGTRPADRDPVDKRLLEQIAAGKARIIDRPTDAGPIPEIPETHRVAAVPSDPLAVLPLTGETRLEAWLCLEHLEVGGAPSPRCAQSAAALKAALGGQ